MSMQEEYLGHPLLESGVVEDRQYQRELADSARSGHTLVTLPTGLGKTPVSLIVTAHRLHEAGGKALMLAPTKPLVQQHAAFYREALAVPEEEVVVFTGEVSPDDRGSLWGTSTVVIATPQVIENDLIGGRISLREVTHLTFDECHRATGDYAYGYIAERYHEDAADPLVTGLSASPGGDEEAILEVCENLGIAEVEVRTEDDADVSEYAHGTDVEWTHIELPDDVIEIRDALNEVIEDRLETLGELGVTKKTSPNLSESDLQKIRGRLQELINNGQSEGYQGMSVHAEIRKLKTAVTYVETQSVESLRRYFERQKNAARSSGASKADQRFVSEPKVKEAMRRAEAYDDLHPKFRRARMLLAETLGIRGGDRVIVFTESRDTAETLTDFLGEHFSTRKFVGQADREGSDGMSQTEQQDALEEFRDGTFEVLVSTSVAEEGLDVPEVDLVLFYEPVPTAIRSIQRKGRTGRQARGRVVVLLAEDTRDEAYFWISRRRETEMEEELRQLKSAAEDIQCELDQRGLGEFESPGSAEPGTGASGTAEPAPEDSGTGGETTDAGATTADGGTATADDGATGSGGGQRGLGDFTGDDALAATAGGEEGVEVVADQRELDSAIARDLSRRDEIDVRLETLEVGDYVCSDRVVVERKSVSDFLDTLVGGDRSMFEQVGEMASHYARPVVVVEGEADLYEERNVHPNAIRGALAALAIDFDASVLRTDGEDDTADMLAVLAGREQEESDRRVSVHGEKSTKTLPEQQEYVVASIAEVGPVTARSLLSEFRTVEAVMTATTEDLMEAEGVGEVTAERMREVIGSEYAPE
ncbi:MAG: DEAD/DEAH box helicase [Halobacteriales archaeon]